MHKQVFNQGSYKPKTLKGDKGMLQCLPCLDGKLVFSLLRHGGTLSGSDLSSSWLKVASGPKWYAMQES
jgi:hypothetical protein